MEHTNHTTLIEGTNASLTWRFSLSSDLTFDSFTIRFNGDAIAGVRSSGQGLLSGFEDKYGISWIPSQRITLYIFHVTTAQNGTFVCEVTATKGLATPSWESNIHVDLLGKLYKCYYKKYRFIINLVIQFFFPFFVWHEVHTLKLKG